MEMPSVLHNGLRSIDQRLDALIKKQWLGGRMVTEGYPQESISEVNGYIGKTYDQWITDVGSLGGLMQPSIIYAVLYDLTGLPVRTVREGSAGTAVIWPITQFGIANGLNGKDFLVHIMSNSHGVTLQYFDTAGKTVTKVITMDNRQFVETIHQLFPK